MASFEIEFAEVPVFPGYDIEAYVRMSGTVDAREWRDTRGYRVEHIETYAQGKWKIVREPGLYSIFDAYLKTREDRIASVIEDALEEEREDRAYSYQDAAE